MAILSIQKQEGSDDLFGLAKIAARRKGIQSVKVPVFLLAVPALLFSVFFISVMAVVQPTFAESADQTSTPITPQSSTDSDQAASPTASTSISDENNGMTQPTQSETTATAEQPKVSLSATPTTLGGTTTTAAVTATIDSAHLQHYTMTLNGGVVTPTATTQGTTTTLSYTVDVAALQLKSGKYNVVLDTHYDNGKDDQETTVVTIDTTPPTVAIGNDDAIVQTGSITPVVSVTNDDPTNSVPSSVTPKVVTYQWTADAANPSPLHYDQTTMAPVFTPVKEGVYTFIVQASDSLGNMSKTSFHFTYVKQLATLPVPTSTDPIMPSAKGEAVAASASSVPKGNPPVRTTGNEVADTATVNHTQLIPGVLGIVDTGSTIAPARQGVQFFGTTWYWWVMVAAVGLVASLLIKKVATHPFASASSSTRG